MENAGEEDENHSTSVKGSNYYITVLLVDFVSFSSSTKGRQQKIVMLQNAMNIVFQLFRKDVPVQYSAKVNIL